MTHYCPNCSSKVNPDELFCQYCGCQLEHTLSKPLKSSKQHPSVNTSQNPNSEPFDGLPKYRVVAAFLAIVFGTFSVHKFYLNKTRSGFVRLLFFWTGVPTVWGLIDALLYLTDSEENFQLRINPTNLFPPKQPERDKWVAVVLAIVFGVCGAHHWFLHDGSGIWYTVFFFTGIPWIMSVFEGIIIFFEPQENFEKRYGW
ncbi:MAG: TM2 domain-containing protein [Promethearchaeota archaeon]|nr:MAG: TM2 domain-containing protein [Candidatus Lokiarchaeota archaeon]